ncbi:MULTISPECIES: hypothetical protein [unclassified Brevundimonas]|nr:MULTISPECIES: hypothetical protein [unclassified Brevundimonas]
MAAVMKAAVVREFGKPLVIEDAPIPTPGPGMIQVFSGGFRRARGETAC